MELNSIFGLPAHPLIVHAAVVMLPLAAVTLIVAALIPRARRVAAPLALGLAFVATVAVSLAQGSGEQLQGQVKETALVLQHAEAADAVLPWAIVVLLAAVAVTAVGPIQRRLGHRSLSPKLVNGTIAVLALVAGTGATITVIDVGHSGAKATWNGTVLTPGSDGG